MFQDTFEIASYYFLSSDFYHQISCRLILILSINAFKSSNCDLYVFSGAATYPPSSAALPFIF